MLNVVILKKQGDIGVGWAIAHLSQIGTVSIPLTDSQEYDLIVDIENEGLFRVQVKTTSFRVPSGSYNVSLTVKGGNKSSSKIKEFDKTKVDLVYVLTSEGTEYLIPVSEIGKGSITLGIKYKKFII